MGKKATIAGVVVFAVLLLITILFIATRPSSAKIGVRHINIIRSGVTATLTLELTNQSARSYGCLPVELEVCSGPGWHTCFKFESYYPRPSFILDPYRSVPFTFTMTNLPADSPLRLRIRVQKMLLGLEGFPRRINLRLHRQVLIHQKISLNPFDRQSKVFAQPTEIVSDEFVEPEPDPALLDDSPK